jgi:hypothetical protein
VRHATINRSAGSVNVTVPTEEPGQTPCVDNTSLMPNLMADPALNEVSTGRPPICFYEELEDKQEVWTPTTKDESDYRPTEEMQSHMLPPPINTDIYAEETD